MQSSSKKWLIQSYVWIRSLLFNEFIRNVGGNHMSYQSGLLRLITGVAFGVICLNGVALAKDVPPLPDGIVIAEPDASVPTNIAKFVGTWNGVSDLGPTTMTFIVTDVAASGEAMAIYAWAAGEEKGFQGPVVANIEGNMLTMPPIFGPGYLLTFEMQADESLKFVYGVYGADKKISQEFPSVLYRAK